MKLVCPYHEEATPSCHVYSDGYRCFGCGANGPLSDLDGRIKLGEIPKEREPEDMGPMNDYIDSLPLQDVRGLRLHSDERSYFIRWPGRSFYKRRFFDPGKGPKYVGPAGHQPPLFWAAPHLRPKAIAIVEGELNSLSVAHAFPEWAVCSPGSASNFTEKNLKLALRSILSHSIIYIIADNDVPGAGAVISAKGYLTAKGRSTKWVLMSPDANDVLVKCGSDELRRQVQQALGETLEVRA